MVSPPVIAPAQLLRALDDSSVHIALPSIQDELAVTPARRLSHMGRELSREYEVPAVRWNGPAQPLDDKHRWNTACRLLHNNTLKPEDHLARPAAPRSSSSPPRSPPRSSPAP